MRTVRLCAIVGGILAACLNAGRADEQFTILGDASYAAQTQPIQYTAYQDPGAVPPPPADTGGQPMENAPAPAGPYQYMGPTPAGPVVIENGWGDVWNQCCQPWCKLGYIVAGVEATFLAPVDEPTQTVRFTDISSGPLHGQRYRGEADPGFGAGVRTWLGLEQCGYGIRARYWHFGNDFIDVDPDIPVTPAPAFLETYSLNANVFDLELYHKFCFAHHTLNASFGARYAHIERTAAVTGFGTVGGVDLLGLAVGSNEIEGTGFTASIGAVHPLCCFGNSCCDSCCDTGCAPCCNGCGLNFFWNIRGSVLWADSTVAALTDANATVSGLAGAAQASSRDKAIAQMDKDNVWNLEGQLGLEYNFCLCRLPGIFSLRGGFEVQHWDTGDLLARSNSFAFLQGTQPPFGGLTEAEAEAHDGDLDLIGFFLGLQYKF